MTVTISFVLLVAALLAFLLSTRQFKWFIRAPIWILGVLLLAGAGFFAVDVMKSEVGLLRIVEDAATHDHAGGDSVLASALDQNWITVDGALAPMFNLFFVISIGIAVIALIALTPGTWMERLLRPLMIALIGAIGGGFVALSLVATGMGGYPEDRVYVSQSVEVVDGDTVKIGDVTLRLAGIDAPEVSANPDSASNQRCARGNQLYQCGRIAKERLAQMLLNELVVCARPADEAMRDSQLRESFGRPIVTCTVHPDGEAPFDAAHRMVEEGHADVFRDGDEPAPLYLSAVCRAQQDRRGMWEGGTITPAQWRNDDAARQDFLNFPRPTFASNLRNGCS